MQVAFAPALWLHLAKYEGRLSLHCEALRGRYYDVWRAMLQLPARLPRLQSYGYNFYKTTQGTETWAHIEGMPRQDQVKMPCSEKNNLPPWERILISAFN